MKAARAYHLALACDKVEVSDRAAAEIAKAVFRDIGTGEKPDIPNDEKKNHKRPRDFAVPKYNLSATHYTKLINIGRLIKYLRHL